MVVRYYDYTVAVSVSMSVPTFTSSVKTINVHVPANDHFYGFMTLKSVFENLFW